MAELKYKRVLLKLSGEALAGEKQIGIDPHTVSKICAEIADVVDMGLEVALVIGAATFSGGCPRPPRAWIVPPRTTWVCSPQC